MAVRDGGGGKKKSAGPKLPTLKPGPKPTAKVGKPTKQSAADKTATAKANKNPQYTGKNVPVKQAGKGFAGSGSPLGTSLKLSQPTKASNVAKALLAITFTPSSGQFSRWAAGKVGGMADDAAFRAASKGLSASGKGGKVSRTMTPMGPNLRSTRIGTEAQQAARMANLTANAERIAGRTGRIVAGQTRAVIRKAGSTAKSIGATAATAKIVKDSKNKKK